MKTEDLMQAIEGLVYVYINNREGYGKYAKLRLNPTLLTVDLETANEFRDELADSDEAIEDAAAAQGDETMSASDYQAAQDPVFYEVADLVKDGKPDRDAIRRIAEDAIAQSA